MKGIVVSVGYDDIHQITLPRMARHCTEILVVTSPDDFRIPQIVKETPSTRIFITNAFTRRGELFNKGAALEEGFDALGRDGWILVHDADILLPDKFTIDFDKLDPSKLYGARRRILVNMHDWKTADWKKLPLSRESGWPGYFQLFHGSCSRLRKRPWYGTESPHAGIGDAYFQSHWPAAEKEFLPLEVLHLGSRDVNWFGRAHPRMDGLPTTLTTADADKLFAKHKWKRPK